MTRLLRTVFSLLAFSCSIAIAQETIVTTETYAGNPNAEEQMTLCEVVPSNPTMSSLNGVFHFAQPQSLYSFSFYDRAAADRALDIFEMNEFVRICSVADSKGKEVFRYLNTVKGMPPGHYDEELEDCQSFLESKIKAGPNRAGTAYEVKSNGKLLVGNIYDLATAKAIESTMKNLRMNAVCKVANSNFVYWKSLYNPPAPGGDSARPDLQIKSLEWNVDVLGFRPEYQMPRADVQRELPVGVSFTVENKDRVDALISTQVRLDEIDLGSSKVTIPANQKKLVTLKNDVILSESGTSKTVRVFVDMETKRDNKTYEYSMSGQFKVVVAQ